MAYINIALLVTLFSPQNIFTLYVFWFRKHALYYKIFLNYPILSPSTLVFSPTEITKVATLSIDISNDLLTAL